MLRPMGSAGQGGSLAPRAYRLIDALLQPHPQLDGLYDSIEEAIRDAIELANKVDPEFGAELTSWVKDTLNLVGRVNGMQG